MRYHHHDDAPIRQFLKGTMGVDLRYIDRQPLQSSVVSAL